MSEEKIDVKIGTIDEKFWTDVKKRAEDEILNSKREIEINKHVLILAEKRIEEEQKI